MITTERAKGFKINSHKNEHEMSSEQMNDDEHVYLVCVCCDRNKKNTNFSTLIPSSRHQDEDIFEDENSLPLLLPNLIVSVSPRKVTESKTFSLFLPPPPLPKFFFHFAIPRTFR